MKECLCVCVCVCEREREREREREAFYNRIKVLLTDERSEIKREVLYNEKKILLCTNNIEVSDSRKSGEIVSAQAMPRSKEAPTDLRNPEAPRDRSNGAPTDQKKCRRSVFCNPAASDVI